MNNYKDDASRDQDRVAAAYRELASGSSPGSHLDARVLQLARAQLQRRQPTNGWQRLFSGRGPMLAAPAALLLMAIFSIGQLLQEPPPGLQPATPSSTPGPSSRVPPIKGPVLVLPPERRQIPEPPECEPDSEQQCPQTDGQEPAKAR